MAKPSITTRTAKGTALDYTELDANFTNLQDATVSLTAGTGGTAVVADLNGNITLVAGSGISLSGNNTAKTITITNTSQGANAFANIAVSGQTTVAADSTADTLTLVAGTGITITTNATTDTITLTASNVSQGLPLQGSSNPVIYAGAGGDLIIRDNSTNASPQSFIKLNSDTVDASELESKSYWLISAKDTTETYNIYLSADVKTLTYFEGGGVRLPNVTTTERDNTNYTGVLKTGVVVFNTTTGNFEGYNGTSWVTLG